MSMHGLILDTFLSGYGVTMNRRKYADNISTGLRFFAFEFLFLSFTYWRGGYGIELQGVTDLFHNFEALDPEVLNVFTFRNKATYRKEDPGEMDITDVDTSDILNCFSTLSYTCFQRKIIVYIDTLNRVNRVNLFGGYMSFVKVSQGVTPPISEQLLASRHISDENSLASLLREIFEDFIDTHILRITVPVLNTRFDARSARGHCYDFSLGEAAKLTVHKDTDADINNTKAPTCYRGDQSMVALSSALVMKMIWLFPTLLKVIAAKAIFGLIMGIVSVVLSKMTILPMVMTYANKNMNQPYANSAPVASSFRQGTGSSSLTLTTEKYVTYRPREEPPLNSNPSGSDYELTTTSGNAWLHGGFKRKNSNGREPFKDFPHTAIPRKERIANFRNEPAIKSKAKISSYPEVVINGRSVEGVTVPTVSGSTTNIAVEKTEAAKNVESSINTPSRATHHRYLNEGISKFERSF